MNLRTTAVVLTALLTVVGGAAAYASTGPTNTSSDAPSAAAGDANVATTYDNGTVTVAVTDGGTPVENATVEVGDGEFATDANGSVTVANVTVEDDLSVEVETDAFDAELTYSLDDGALTLQELEMEYETDDGDETPDSDEDSDEDDEDSDDEDQTDEENETADSDEDSDAGDEVETGEDDEDDGTDEETETSDLDDG